MYVDVRSINYLYIMSPGSILVTNAKDFIQHIAKSITDDKKLQDALLAKYRAEFANLITSINKLNKQECDSLHFAIRDYKLYYSLGGEEEEVYNFYATIIKAHETTEDKILHVYPMFGMLISSLKCILYREGFNYIAYIFKNISDSLSFLGTDPIDQSDNMSLSLYFGGIYGETMNKYLVQIDVYRKMLEGVDGFSFKEWDDKRAQLESKVLLDLSKNNSNLTDFMSKYIETLIVLMSRSVCELEELAAKLKFN